jgi:hypothetical protein
VSAHHHHVLSGADKVPIRDWSYSGEGEAVPAKDETASPIPVENADKVPATDWTYNGEAAAVPPKAGLPDPGILPAGP